MEKMDITMTAVATLSPTAELAQQITAKTTLSDVLALLNLEPGQKKPAKTPTPKKLRISCEIVANMRDCVLFSNGFVYYNNSCNHSVIWIPYCVSFTYHFNPLKDSEKDALKGTDTLKDGLLEENPWVTAASLIAEHRIEYNMDTNAGIGYADKPELADDEDEASIDSYSAKDCYSYFFMWRDEPINVNPLDAVCRKEMKEEILAALTDKQREVFTLIYKDGYTQETVASMLGLSRSTIKEQIKAVKKKLKKFLNDTHHFDISRTI